MSQLSETIPKSFDKSHKNAPAKELPGVSDESSPVPKTWSAWAKVMYRDGLTNFEFNHILLEA